MRSQVLLRVCFARLAGMAWLVVCALWIANCAAEERPRDSAGFAPTTDGIRAYLESLLDPTLNAGLDALIAQLSDSEFAVREQAAQRILRMGFPPLDKLTAATKSSDLEKSWRAQSIIHVLQAGADTPLLSALELVRERKLAVGMPLLMAIHARATGPRLQAAALAAMLAIVVEADRQTVQTLLNDENLYRRNAGRKLLACLTTPGKEPLLEGTFAAVRLTPGGISGGGSNLIVGWEFKATSNLKVIELGIYDHELNGLLVEHDVAVWDVEDATAPLAQGRVAAGSEAPLEGVFRYVPVKPAMLKAGRSYAVVAHYAADSTEMTVSLTNPRGLTVDYAPHFEVVGRRYAFPHKAMAFPDKRGEEAKSATFGPTFRYEAAPDAP